MFGNGKKVQEELQTQAGEIARLQTSVDELVRSLDYVNELFLVQHNHMLELEKVIDRIASLPAQTDSDLN